MYDPARVLADEEVPCLPELPDITIYVERLNALAVGHVLKGMGPPSMFLLNG